MNLNPTQVKNCFKLAGSGILLTLAMLTMASCDKDDDEPSDSGNGSGSGNGKTAVIDFDGDVLSYVGDNDIYYDNKGRVEAIYGHYDEYLEIDYSRGTIDVEGEEGKIKFNGNGYISEMSTSWDYTEGNYRYNGSSKYVFSYNSSGYLTGYTFTGNETERNSSSKETFTAEWNVTVTMSWSGGNLLSTTWKDVGKEDGERYTWNGKYNISYGSKQNKFGQIPFTVSDYAIFDNCLLNALTSVGLFGKGPKNLPTYLEEIDEGEYDYSIDMDFILNRNGSIDTEYRDDDAYYYGYTSLDSKAKVIRNDKAKNHKSKKQFGRKFIHQKNMNK